MSSGNREIVFQRNGETGGDRSMQGSKNVRLVVLAVVAIAMLMACLPAMAATTASQSTVQVQVGKVYYQLPRWSVGAKLVAYSSDYAGGNYPSGANPALKTVTTPDDKNWIQCIKEMKLGFMGASMTSQGKPPNKGTPMANYDDWRVAANAVVASGGGIMIEYMGGPVGIGTSTGSTIRPEVATNVDTGNWSPQNCADWADYMASVNGADKIALFEFYNEPATQHNASLGDTSGIFWYAYGNSMNPNSPDRLCADWATNHQQDYYKLVKKKYPNAVLCGSSFAAPGQSYNQSESLRYLRGYSGARVSPANPNTKYQDAVSIHGYGYASDTVTSPTPGAPSGLVQSTYNSIFYPTVKDPGNVSGYKAGADQWISESRALPGGSTMKLVDTEWWAYSPNQLSDPTYKYPSGGVEGSHQAVADVLGWIVHCQNADRWQFRAIQFHAANVSEGNYQDSRGRPTKMVLPDGMFCSYQSHIFRTGRYYAVKDICARFANNYPSLVRCSVQGPASPAGPRHNSPGTQIQSCAALNKTKSMLAVCVANIGNSKQTVNVAFGQHARSAVNGVKIPTILDVETPLTKLSALPFTDSSHQAVTVTLEGYTAALVEVPL